MKRVEVIPPSFQCVVWRDCPLLIAVTMAIYIWYKKCCNGARVKVQVKAEVLAGAQSQARAHVQATAQVQARHQVQASAQVHARTQVKTKIYKTTWRRQNRATQRLRYKNNYYKNLSLQSFSAFSKSYHFSRCLTACPYTNRSSLQRIKIRSTTTADTTPVILSHSSTSEIFLCFS